MWSFDRDGGCDEAMHRDRDAATGPAGPQHRRTGLRTVEVHGRTTAAAGEVWAVLADPFSYVRWVCGTVRIRRADPTWPAPGARLFHTFGPWPLRVHDDTRVIAADPPRRLVLQARARPLGSVRAEIILAPDATGTLVTLRQQLQGGLGAWFALAGHAVQAPRNRRSLANLLALCDAGGRR